MAEKKVNPEMGENSLPKEKPVEAPKSETIKSTASKKVAAKAETAKPAGEKIVKGSAKMNAIDVKAKEPPVEMKAEIKASVKKAELPKTEPEKAAVPAARPLAKEQKADQPSGLDRGALFFGGGLFFMGVLLLLGRLLQIPFGVFLWPFIFIIPGVLVFLTALSSDSSSGEGLSILGGILTSLGMLFLLQSMTNLWATWAYAWALVAPTSIGFSQMIYGERKNREAIVQSGRRLANIGLTIFAVGFIFFELILGISGYGLGRFGLPVFPMILIFAGLVILVRSYLRNRK